MILNRLRQRAIRNIQKRLCCYVRSRFEMVSPEPTQGLFNFRCFDNVAEYARINPGIEVVEVVYIDRGEPILHYVNYDPDKVEYLETTLGYMAESLEYYKIRKIHPDDYFRMGAEFSRSQESWSNQWVNWYHKLLGVERIL